MKQYKPTGWSLFINILKQDGFFHPVYAFILILLLFSFSVQSQKQNNIWCFGDSAGIDFNNLSNPVTFSSSLDTRGSCVSIADTNGQLLFYANTVASSGVNTTKIWNKNNILMENLICKFERIEDFLSAVGSKET